MQKSTFLPQLCTYYERKNRELTIPLKKLQKHLISYEIRCFFGGDKRDRTADLLNAILPHMKNIWKISK